MKEFMYKLLGTGLSHKRFISILGTVGIIAYTFLSNDPAPLTTIVIVAIGGNVMDKYVASKSTKNE